MENSASAASAKSASLSSRLTAGGIHTDDISLDSIGLQKADAISLDSVQRADAISLDSIQRADAISLDSVQRTDAISLASVEKTDAISLDSVQRTDAISLASVERTDAISLDSVQRTDAISLDSVQRKLAGSANSQDDHESEPMTLNVINSQMPENKIIEGSNIGENSRAARSARNEEQIPVSIESTANKSFIQSGPIKTRRVNKEAAREEEPSPVSAESPVNRSFIHRGPVYTRKKVRSVTKLSRGDHIAWYRPMGYWHHAIYVGPKNNTNSK